MWFMNKIANPFVKLILRSPLHGWMSAAVLLITYRGRKSGKEYTLPVQYVQDGNNVYIVPGFAEKKTWWRNLKGGADLRDKVLRYCVGCWGCWVKTLGEYANRDASLDMDRAVINADFVLWASPLKMGFPAELLKRALDKHLPLIHPCMVVDQGEAHHLNAMPVIRAWDCYLKRKQTLMPATCKS